MASKDYNLDMNILGKIKIISPNVQSAGAVLTWSTSSREVSHRTNAQFISDLDLATVTWSNGAFISKNHVVNGITSTNITNWNNAVSWGNHAGLYALIGHNHDDRYYTETESDTKYVPYTGATKAVNLGANNLELGIGGVLSKNHSGSKILNKVYQADISTAVTGILSIKFVQQVTTGTMFDITIKIYGYNNRFLGEVRISFYKISGTSLHSSGAKALIKGTSNFPLNTVQVGIDGSNNVCINLGSITTSWGSYLSFEVSRVEAKYAGINADWSIGWSHSVETVAPDLVANGGTYVSILDNVSFATEFIDTHTHTNKAFLDTINQNLGTTHTPTFNTVKTSRSGIIGTYSASQTQAVWSMDNSFTVNTTLTGLGTLYGIGYSYISVGGSSLANKHQIHFAENGVAKITMNMTDGEVRANRFTSMVPTGTAPMSITSTTVVPNLNADLLDGLHSTSFMQTSHAANGITSTNITNWNNAASWGNHGGLYSSRAVLGATANSVMVDDTRNANPLPTTNLQFGTWFDFKDASVLGIPSNYAWAGVMTLVPYGDDTGNDNSAFRLAQSNNKLFFQNYLGGAWKTWNELWHSGNFNPSNYVTTNTAQFITSHKIFLDGGGDEYHNAGIEIRRTVAGKFPTLGFHQTTDGYAGTIRLKPGAFEFRDAADSFITLRASKFIVSGANNTGFLKAGGAVDYTQYAINNGTTSWEAASKALLLNPTIQNLTLNNSGQTVALQEATQGHIAGIVNSSGTAAGNPTENWYHRIKMLHPNSLGYYTEIAVQMTGGSTMWFRTLEAGNSKYTSKGGASGWIQVVDDTNHQTIVGNKRFLDAVNFQGGISIAEDYYGGEVGIVDTNDEYAFVVRAGNYYNLFGAFAGTVVTDGFVRSKINNNYSIDATPVSAHKLNVGGSILATSFYESSLRKLKENIKPFEKSAIDLINKLDIVTFDRKDKTVKDKIGIIADDSPKEFLSKDLDAVDLYKTVFIQAKAIQELKSEIDELKELVKQLLK